ncbi:SAVED domain-containing protein [Streptomyces anulatus]|uniref:SAVED domain-containing protein n=1 Tax=Streptomyces anulatus TaxID=1892 RepID=UPI0038641110|nr:SAVED domain-containing protein [Streptomyces anulatus]
MNARPHIGPSPSWRRIRSSRTTSAPTHRSWTLRRCIRGYGTASRACGVEDLAVGINVTVKEQHFTQDVLEYLEGQNIPASRLLVLTPPAGPKDRSVLDSPAANALAVGVRDALRRPSHATSRIHLFLACPMGLALLLGHRWNRLRPTVVYEDVSTAQVYEPAFFVQA